MFTSALTDSKVFKNTIGNTSSYFKRTFYMSSLAGLVMDKISLEESVLLKLRSLLNLNLKAVKSSNIPVVCSKLFWKNSNVIQHEITVLRECTSDTSDDKEAIYLKLKDSANLILLHTPEWIKYSSDENMITDIINIFNPDHKVFSNA